MGNDKAFTMEIVEENINKDKISILENIMYCFFTDCYVISCVIRVYIENTIMSLHIFFMTQYNKILFHLYNTLLQYQNDVKHN